ncbi:MAG TPA: O-antigen ligase family protein [Bacteroidales bacterium]|nr:O-antigen ligase family protein [Bacteroidales bacterium]
MNSYATYKAYSHEVYFWLLAFIAISMPYMELFSIIGLILLFINWILEGNFSHKLSIFKHKKSISVFSAIFFIHVIWLLGTSQWDEAFRNIFIKLPLLILPVIIGTSEPIKIPKVRKLLQLFIGSVSLAVVAHFIISKKWLPVDSDKILKSGIFVSKSQLTCMVVVSTLTLFHWIKSMGRNFKASLVVYIVLAILMLVYLASIHSLAGLIVLAITFLILVISYINRLENQMLKIGLIMLIYAIPFFSIVLMIKTYHQFFHSKQPEYNVSQLFTKAGNPYYNQSASWEIENGNKVWVNVCEKELSKEWNKISEIKYEDLDLKGQPLRLTLIRYMTSKGLKKDAEGIALLSGRDIINVQKGMTNYIFDTHWSLLTRIYEVFWEVHQFKHSKCSSQEHSLSVRLEKYHIALSVAAKHLFFGVGTGDLDLIYSDLNKGHKICLKAEDKNDTGNQFLYVLCSFGIIGLILFIFALVLPGILEMKWDSYYFLMIFCVIVLSFFVFEVLESFAGTIFCTFFYSFYLWGTYRNLE